MQTLQSHNQRCTRVQWIMAGVMVLIIAAFYMFGFRPLSNRQAALAQDIVAKRTALQTEQDEARKLPEVTMEVNRLRARVEKFDKKMPKQADIGNFIRDINQLSQQTSLKKMTVTPGMPRKTQLYSELPISLNFEGDFVSVHAFLRQAESMQRLTRVRNVNVKNNDPVSGQVQVELSMNIYFSEG
jgi:Tfp pilus assembly protein PilO